MSVEMVLDSKVQEIVGKAVSSLDGLPFTTGSVAYNTIRCELAPEENETRAGNAAGETLTTLWL